MQRSASCRSRRELSNEYLLDEIGVDTAENEPLEVWGKIQFSTKVFIRLLNEVSMNKQLLEVVEKTLKERDDAEEVEAA